MASKDVKEGVGGGVVAFRCDTDTTGDGAHEKEKGELVLLSLKRGVNIPCSKDLGIDCCMPLLVRD